MGDFTQPGCLAGSSLASLVGSAAALAGAAMSEGAIVMALHDLLARHAHPQPLALDLNFARGLFPRAVRRVPIEVLIGTPLLFASFAMPRVATVVPFVAARIP